MSTFTATAGGDNITGTVNADTFIFPTGTVQAGDIFNGGAGTDTIQVGSTTAGVTIDFSVATLTSFEALKFNNSSGTSTATFSSAQLGTTLAITGVSGSTQNLIVNMASAGTYDTSAWTFTTWSSVGTDTLTINGSTGND